MARRSLTVLLLALTVVTGCQTVYSEHPGGISAVYTTPTLRTTLQAPLPAVAAAAAEAVTRRGYAVTEQAVTDDRALLVAQPPHAGTWTSLVVECRTEGAATRARITHKPWGDPEASQALLTLIISSLGLDRQTPHPTPPPPEPRSVVVDGPA